MSTLTLKVQQGLWQEGIAHGQALRRVHASQAVIVIGKRLLDLAFFEAIDYYDERESINCFVTGFVNGYLSV